jgi:hypothetical protein
VASSVGGGPGFNFHWVELMNDLTVSLLQARLIELGLPLMQRSATH